MPSTSASKGRGAGTSVPGRGAGTATATAGPSTAPPPSSKEGGQGQPGAPPRSQISSRNGSQPRQSTATQLQLKVMRTCIERLMKERAEIKEIKRLMQEVIRSWDSEIQMVERMTLIAKTATLFQQGTIDLDMTEKVLNVKIKQEEPEGELPEVDVDMIYDPNIKIKIKEESCSESASDDDSD